MNERLLICCIWRCYSTAPLSLSPSFLPLPLLPLSLSIGSKKLHRATLAKISQYFYWCWRKGIRIKLDAEESRLRLVLDLVGFQSQEMKKLDKGHSRKDIEHIYIILYLFFKQFTSHGTKGLFRHQGAKKHTSLIQRNPCCLCAATKENLLGQYLYALLLNWVDW